MKAMRINRIVDMAIEHRPLVRAEVPVPQPGREEIRINVSVCGVCHTELDEIEGRTSPPRLPVTPGHEVVGTVDACGPGVIRFSEGDRVGVGWIHHSDGGRLENLAAGFVATGRDVDGGYADYMIAHQDYAFAIPEVFTDAQVAPLLCAGGVGYRALRLTGISDGQRLGFAGFGGSAHIVLQIARYLYPALSTYVLARDEGQRRFALDLGADWAGSADGRTPEPLDAVIDTTPAWAPVLGALANLRPAGRLVINAIRKESVDQDVLLSLDYDRHLWLEKELKTVANVTSDDIRRCLEVAARIPLLPEIQTYRFEDANLALAELRAGKVRGAKVLLVNP